MAMKGKTAELTKKDIEHLAGLSQLSLTDEELEKIGSQLNETLSYVSNLDDFDTTKVDASAHVSGKTNVFREDVVHEDRMLTQEQALANGKYTKNGYFVVKKII